MARLQPENREKLERELKDKNETAGSIVPDAFMTTIQGEARLIEVKTVTSQKYYQECDITQQYGNTGRQCPSPVDKRASEIHPNYHRRAHEIDVKYNGTPAESRTGPMEATLRQYGDIVPVVCGKRGEMNKATHDLVKKLAWQQAEATFDELGYKTPEGPLPALKRGMYLRWGCTNVKAHALCLKTLLELSDGGEPVTRHQHRRAKLIENTRNLMYIESHPQSCAPTPGRWG